MRIIRTFIMGTSDRLAAFFMGVSVNLAMKEPDRGEINDDELNEVMEEYLMNNNRMVFTGSCFPVSNFLAHPAANRDYYVVALRNPTKSEQTDVYMFTEKELIRAQDRADKNMEDIPADIGAFNKIIDRTED